LVAVAKERGCMESLRRARRAAETLERGGRYGGTRPPRNESSGRHCEIAG